MKNVGLVRRGENSLYADYAPSIFDTFFDKVSRDFINSFADNKVYLESVTKSGAYPKFDVVDSTDSLNFFVALPGLKKEDVTISYSNGILSISAEKTVVDESKDSKYVWRELHRSKFSRVLCTNVQRDVYDVDNISATMSDGILTIKLPKRVEEQQKSETKKIEIK